MEVTKHNFKEALGNFKSLVKNADFISFDLEFTGLGMYLGDKNNELDTPEERYQKAMKKVTEYGIPQIGISLFRYCKSSNTYLNATFCFFLSGKLEGSYRFDTSSMMFLADNGFDFNKLFLEGLTFLSLTDEMDIRNKRNLKLQQERSESRGASPIKLKEDKGKNFESGVIKKIKKSLHSGEPVILEGRLLNSFFRKVIFQNVAPKFPSSYFQNVSGMERNIKVIHFPSVDDRQKFIDVSWEDELTERLGFSHVVKAILESNKPMVGHNVFLDLLHFTDKFVAPLPPRLDSFKTIFKNNLPPIYDTKILARDPPFSATLMNTALGYIYEELTSKYSPPKIEPDGTHQGYNIREVGQAHDGGYDAFMTGVCFITMLKTLEGRQWGKSPMMKSKRLEAYKNKINFMNSVDIPYIDLERPDVIPDRSYVFVVSCPSSWSNQNIRNTFSCLKGYKSIWVNETKIFVIPQDEEDVKRAQNLLKDIRAACPPTAKVDLYEPKKEEEASKKNGKFNSGLKTRSKEVTRPSSIALKRSSDSKDISGGGSEEGTSLATDCTDDSGRNLKRLKSVGSELLSNMTLESPMNVDKEPLNHNDHQRETKANVLDKTEVFNVPDDW